MNPAASAPASAAAGPDVTGPAVPATGTSDRDPEPVDDLEHDRSQPVTDAGRDHGAGDRPGLGDPVGGALGGRAGGPAASPLAAPGIPPATSTRATRRPVRRSALSRAATDLRWLLGRLVDDAPGIRSVVVVSSDGLLLLSSDLGGTDAVAAPPEPAGAGTEETNGGLATIVAGLGSLTVGAARLMDAGEVRQTVVAMDYGNLFVMSVSDGSLLGVHADPDCDVNVVAYEMGLFVGRAGHVLTPEVRGELRRAADPTGSLD